MIRKVDTPSAIPIRVKRSRAFETPIMLGVALLACLGLATHTLASSNPSITTFAEGDVWEGLAQQTYPKRTLTHPMQVSDEGDVIYTSSVDSSFRLLSRNNETITLSTNSESRTVQITSDGETILAGGRLHHRENNYAPSGTGGRLLSADGRVTSNGSYGPGSNGNNIANYPGYTVYDRYTTLFENPWRHSAWDAVINKKPGADVVTFKRGFYEEVYLADISGDGQLFLTSFSRPYENPDWELGEKAWYEKYDITLLSLTGAYHSSPFNVEYAAAMSMDASKVLAFNPHPNCPMINPLEFVDSAHSGLPHGQCAVIWHTRTNQVLALGNFHPNALSGDGTIALGYSFSDENHPMQPVIWTAQEGLQNFVSFMQGRGIDLSEWSDIYPVAISKDGSQIAGHGINANGVREGFRISLPAKKSEKWQRYAASQLPVTELGNWQQTTMNQDGSGQIIASAQKGAAQTFTFEGSRVRVYGLKGYEQGYANIFIDNVFWTSIDTFDCALPYTDLLFESDYLGDGKHTLTIEVHGTHNFASQNTVVAIDSIEVEHFAPEYFPQVASDSLIPASKWQEFDLAFDQTNQSPAYETRESCNYWYCTEIPPNWRGRLYLGSEKTRSLTELMAANGDFSAEVWYRSHPYKTNDDETPVEYGPDDYPPGFEDYPDTALLSIESLGKRFELKITPIVGPNWTGRDPNTPTARSVDYGPRSKLDWSHLVVSGNWYSGVFEVYYNGLLLGSGFTESVPDSDVDIVRWARPLDDNVDDLHANFKMAKIAAYDDSLDEVQARTLFEWPTHYGLSFAPRPSPEYTVNLPGCSQGCDPGLDVDGLPYFRGMAGNGNVAVPMGGF